MQRKYQFLWLALVPFGAAGALATGMVSLPWQQSDESSKVAGSPTPAATSDAASAENKAKGGKLAALEKQVKRANPPLTKALENSGKPILSTKKPRKFGIDIARISPQGSSVIAGYAAPGKPVTIMADGKAIGVVTPDQSGDWVLITPHKFTSLDPQISLQTGDHTTKTVAALATKPSAPAKIEQQPAAAKPTASQVTQQMMQRLKKLTEEASAQSAETKTAKVADPQSVRPQPAEKRLAEGRPRAVQPTAKITLTAKTAAPQQQLALATTRSRLGGPEAAGAAVTKKRNFAAAAKPSLPTASNGPSAASNANVKKAALTESIPVPVQFVYRRAVFTDQGRKAAALLLKYFKAKKFNSVALSGHADERGTPAANKKLSRQRLASIRAFLRKGGFKGRLELVAKGETEKFTGVNRSKFSPEELYQLDRRVEVMSAR